MHSRRAAATRAPALVQTDPGAFVRRGCEKGALRRSAVRDVQVAEVVERAAGGAEPAVDLLELRRVEGRAEAGQALAVGQAELGGEVLALQQADVLDAAGKRLGGLDLDRAVALE